MRTVDKAFELLGLFSKREPELGLGEISLRTHFDKATSRRLLLALAKHGLIEQNPETRRYRIGPGVLRLAQVREATLPLNDIVQPILKRLVEGSGETAHFTVLSGNQLATVAMQESPRSNRVNMDLGEILPLHATASGIVILAFQNGDQTELLDQLDLKAFTDSTLVDRKQIEQAMQAARKSGYVINLGYYEADVCSIAVPVFDPTGNVMGTLAVATPKGRFAEENQSAIKRLLIAAAAELTARIGGRTPADKVA